MDLQLQSKTKSGCEAIWTAALLEARHPARLQPSARLGGAPLEPHRYPAGRNTPRTEEL